jgi:flagellin
VTFSINTNNAAMAALESLSKTQSALNSTESAVSTGLKVSNASDNPAIYAISSTMNANIAGLSAVSDSLSFGSSVLSTASSAASSIVSTLTTLQNQVTEAGTTGITTSTMQTAIANALNDINTYARQSTFNGVNLLTTQADANAGGVTNATNSSMQVVDSLNGGTISTGSQITKGTANTLTDQLGLTNAMQAGGTVIATGTATGTEQVQTLLSDTGASGGINIAFDNTLAASSFAAGNTITLTNADNTTTTFQFEDSTAASSTTAEASGKGNNVVTVLVNPAAQSTSQMLGTLASAMSSNGYDANVQSDGSLSITGQGVTGATNSGVTGEQASTALSSTASLVNTIQSAIKNMTSIATSLGYASQQITGLQSFTSSLSDAMTSGVGALVDADLSEESAKLTSLQTKQQLAIQSLSIANSQSASILSLFR